MKTAPLRIDRLVNGVAHEAKAGRNVKLKDVKAQIDADADLIANGRVGGAYWHFFQGASSDTKAYLTERGIPYAEHP
jgi:hypothetical protein